MTEAIFTKISDVSAKDLRCATIPQVLNKLQEETGELSAAYSKKTGFKKTTQTALEVERELAEELVDSMIVLIDLANKLGFSHEYLLSIFPEKIQKWENSCT